MDKKVLSALKEMDIKIKRFDECSYLLLYNDIRMVYKYWPDDDTFLQIGMPLETYGYKDEELYKIANHLNIRLKYVKSCVFNNSMWLIYEEDIKHEENIERLIKEIVLYLMKAMHFYLEIVNDKEDKQDEVN